MNLVTKKFKLAGLNTAFMTALAVYTAQYADAVTAVPSTQSIEDYAWLGDVAQMEEWVGELNPKGLKEYDYIIRNKRFAASMYAYNDDLSDEKYGQLKQRISDLAEKAKAFPGTLVRSLRVNGTSGLCYDGQPFYSTTHVDGLSGSQANLITGTGTTAAAVKTDFFTTRAKMFGYKTDTGDPYVRSNPRFVGVCPPDMEAVLREGLMLGTVATGGQNSAAGLVSAVEVDQGLTGNSWYLEDRSPRIKAFIIQEREMLTSTNTAPGSDTDVKEDATLFRVKWRGNGGYGLWQHSCKIVNS